MRTFPHHGDDRPGRKIFLEIGEYFRRYIKWVFRWRRQSFFLVSFDGLLPCHTTPIRVERIVRLHMRFGGNKHFHSDELQSNVLVSLDYFSYKPALNAVGFDDDKCAFFLRMLHEMHSSAIFIFFPLSARRQCRMESLETRRLGRQLEDCRDALKLKDALRRRAHPGSMRHCRRAPLY